MDRKIQDYLHFYLPIQVELDNGGSKVYNRTAVAIGNMDDEYRYVLLRMGNGAKSFTHPVLYSENRVKPILRQLSDMTEEEKEEFAKTQDRFIKQPNTLPSFELSKIWAAQQTFWFLQRGFDLFNLIPDKLAIDKTTLSL